MMDVLFCWVGAPLKFDRWNYTRWGPKEMINTLDPPKNAMK